ncbi:CaiB/BaiF CoA transferase family protein [Saccharolobus islandicus]|jgi:Predicted acyl-CoA transferases/carnitine dehydratase|uniref:L-carnitine dehydratase/bile acid-inducible protein F n=2 Tax=Saccharolobus islandicus TaxID=43080 RepID=C4KF89_SACI6|nr:CaiB/BaiF CoA-transferase family protein [Sulfolobus islandicus]ACP54630.1 L-carnitine dehydratase/bile acid-inducible protein F [Sulfolobus islandicus M.16.27]ACR41305.1 L-carnitine dehydratase/bile acid-inducible protein F [Sulfolobus islandicus M.16.4]
MYRVIELGHVISVPFAGEILRHLGFEVIKVEPLLGDPSRADDVLGDSMFIFNNRGKRSISIDLKKDKGREVFLKLIENSHVLIENLSPYAMDRLGLSDDVIFSTNPSLIYCSVKGYPKGKYENLPAFGTVIEAESGIMDANGKARLPASITDMNASTYCVITILWALLMKKPGHYRVDIIQTNTVWLGYYFIAFQKYGKLFEGGKDELPFWAPYELFKSSEGKEFYLAVNDNIKFTKLCKALGLDDLLVDGRFKTNADRVTNRKILHEKLQQKFSSMKLEEIINILRYNDIPIGKLNNVKDLVSNELVEWDIFGNVKIPSLPLPGSLNNQDVPDLGEDTLNILKELEYSENEIEDMIKENIIMPNRGEKKA